jgi:hypothetical protein
VLERRNEALTQDGLVAELVKRGYKVTRRRIADWRENGLLPPFDLAGSGRGKSRGRERSSWSDGRRVLDQAVWICELLPVYGTFDRLHFPLWLLGYDIPLARVREVLGGALREMIRAVESEADSPGELEDLIGDATYSYVEAARRSGMAALQAEPDALQEALESFANVIFNPEYDLADAPFEIGVEALQGWRRELQTRLGGGVDVDASPEGENADSVYALAAFAKAYLQPHQLLRAVDESTEDDWQAARRDVEELRELAQVIGRVALTLTRDLPADFRVSMTRLLPAAFAVGGLFVLADLSLRRNGFAGIIDYYLHDVAGGFRREVNERLALELAGGGEDLAAAMEHCFEKAIGERYLPTAPGTARPDA